MPKGQGPRRRKSEVLERDELGRKCCIACKEWLDVSCYVATAHTSDRLSGKCRTCSSYVASTKDRDLRDRLIAEYRNECWCCGRKPTKRNLHVDHDHSCCPTVRGSCGDCVRGLLCSNCNTGIGLLGDNIDGLLLAVNYLRRVRS